jgi:hypothetical protein
LEGVPEELHESGEKIECFIQGARDYTKYLKRGYSRISQLMAFDIRNGRMTLEEAQKHYALEGRIPPSLDLVLEYMGMSEAEFNRVTEGMEVSPHHHDYSRGEVAEKTWDFDQAYREDNRKR